MTPPGFTEGPPIYYRPICQLTRWGFIGGPCGYREVPETDKEIGPIIVGVDDDGFTRVL